MTDDWPIIFSPSSLFPKEEEHKAFSFLFVVFSVFSARRRKRRRKSNSSEYWHCVTADQVADTKLPLGWCAQYAVTHIWFIEYLPRELQRSLADIEAYLMDTFLSRAVADVNSMCN
jgi:hypothetical protein